MKITNELIQEMIKDIPLLYSKGLDIWITPDELFTLEFQQQVLLEDSSDRKLTKDEKKELNWITEQLENKDWIKGTVLDFNKYCRDMYGDKINYDYLDYPLYIGD